ncbi:putative f-box domain-containing protein [Golovinomyces cichoracearum]|uniref:Putative f-box domain-containing protein n=1 Tax=Golovinomyces cichoracearum TaxID=62708 RepID=A0A420IHA5_9PEZI|nr:putative f-box domain-containing protein [Golovinomyces cichoracearum]
MLRLSQMIPLLTTPEIHNLQVQLSSLLQSRVGNEIFINIPHELLLKITESLYLEDLLRVRLVCRSWNRAFTNSDLCLRMTKIHFPFAWEEHCKSFKSKSITKSGVDSKDWLRDSLISRIRREHGISSTRYRIKYDARHSNFQYCNNRIANQTGGVFEVQNLLNQLRTVYPIPNRIEMKKWLLSDKWLMGVLVSPTKLFAWELKDSGTGERHSIRLPTKTFRISAHLDLVGIVTSSFDVLIWTVGGDLRTLHTIKTSKDYTEEIIMAADIFFHYTNHDKYFLVYHTRVKSSAGAKFATRITVKTFMAWELVRTQHIVRYNTNLPLKHQSSLISNDGKIGIEIRGITGKITYGNFELLTYDMISMEFEVLSVRLDPSIDFNLQISNYFIWQDQILYPILDNKNNLTDSLQVITISKSLTDVWNGLSKKFENSICNHLPSSILSSETRADSGHTKMETQNRLYEKRVWADDNFVILFSGAELIVWGFRQRILAT